MPAHTALRARRPALACMLPLSEFSISVMTCAWRLVLGSSAARKGCCPNSITNRTTPHDHTSAASASYAWPAVLVKISGAVKSAVPICVCAALSLNLSLRGRAPDEWAGQRTSGEHLHAEQRRRRQNREGGHPWPVECVTEGIELALGVSYQP